MISIHTRCARLSLLLLVLPGCFESSASVSAPLPAPARDGFTSGAAAPGFLLVTPLKSKDVFLLDMQGEVVQRWATETEPGNSVYLTDRGTLYRCRRIEQDAAFSGGGIGGGVQEIAADGSLLWDYRFADQERQQHHDIEPLPNGNLLLIAWDRKTREVALAHGRDPELLRGELFWPDAIYEVEPGPKNEGKIVWEWHSWDHLIQDFNPEGAHFGVPAEHPERIDINGDRDPVLATEAEQDAELQRLVDLGYAGADDADPPKDEKTAAEQLAGVAEVDGEEQPQAPPSPKELQRQRRRDADWMHTNGIDYSPGLDQIVISVRRFDEIWIIDHSTTSAEAASSTGGRAGHGGDLLYRWGNPAAYGMGTAESRTLIGQHDVQWIEEGQLGAGGLLVFNNGQGRPAGDWSSVDEWWPPMDKAGRYMRADDQPFGPLEVSWSYSAQEPTDFYSSFIGGVQRLPKGNTLICSGESGHVFEVTQAGQTVWEWDCDLVPKEEPQKESKGINPNALFRVTRIPAEHPGLEALRLAGIDIPLDPSGS